MPQGKSVCTLGVATNRYWTDQSGNKQEAVEFHNCVLWGKLADIAGQYVTKGKRIYVEGRLQTREWPGQDGAKRPRTEIVAESMILLDGPRGPAAPGSPQQSPANTYAPADAPATPSAPPPADEEIKVEDIPF